MAIIGRKSARQRRRGATRKALAIDCTPWVTSRLWPAELSTITVQTRGLAEYLRADLGRIAGRTNHELKLINRAGMAEHTRAAHEARVLGEACACAARRVESTIRQLRTMKAQPAAEHPHVQNSERLAGTDFDNRQLLRAVTAVQPAAEAPTDIFPAPKQSTPSQGNGAPVVSPPASAADAFEASQVRHRASTGDSVTTPVATSKSGAASDSEAPKTAGDSESPTERLQRLLGSAGRREVGEPGRDRKPTARRSVAG